MDIIDLDINKFEQFLLSLPKSRRIAGDLSQRWALAIYIQHQLDANVYVRVLVDSYQIGEEIFPLPEWAEVFSFQSEILATKPVRKFLELLQGIKGTLK